MPALTVDQVVQYFSSVFYHGDVVAPNMESIRGSLPRNNQVLIAAMQKSGSTFLHYALSRILDRPMNMACWTSDEGNKRSMFFPFALRDNVVRKAVSRAHMPASQGNVDLMRMFNITPVVLIRNLFDVVASMRDAVVKDLEHKAWDGSTSHHWPYFPSDDPQNQFDKIIDFCVPEFILFYVSWYEAELKQQVPFRWITYREMNRDKVGTIARVLEFLGLSQPESRIQTIVEELDQSPAKTQRNEAVVGRGKALLSDEQQARICNMTRHFPWVDFSRVGVKECCPV